MRLMRIKAVHCMPRTIVIDPAKYKHSYLLRDLKMERRDQVWAVCTTYLSLMGGFMYMVAVIDVHTRYLLNWSITNTMEAYWVKSMINEAIAMHGKPEIINRAFEIAKAANSPARLTRPCSAREAWPKASSSAWRQGASDRQRLHRARRNAGTLKHGQLYLPPPVDGIALYQSCARFIERYNDKRKHSSLG